jgi:hypothetical protein
VPLESHFAERQIRPAVVIRKNSPPNRSERGAATRAILMSVYRTLHPAPLRPGSRQNHRGRPRGADADAQSRTPKRSGAGWFVQVARIHFRAAAPPVCNGSAGDC